VSKTCKASLFSPIRAPCQIHRNLLDLISQWTFDRIAIMMLLIMQFYPASCYLFRLGRTIFLCTQLLNVPCRWIEVVRRIVGITVTSSLSSIGDWQTRNCDGPSQYVGLSVCKHQWMLVGFVEI
jgi:hypothetical protein